MKEKFAYAGLCVLLLTPVILTALLHYPPGAAVLIYVFVAACYEFSRSTLKKHEHQRLFEGQVAGFYASLAVSDIIDDFTAKELYRFSLDEMARCRSIKNERPALQEDPIYYAMGYFGEFALLCAIKYAEGPGSKYGDTKQILEYCHSHTREAKRLTNTPNEWDQSLR